MIVRKHEIFDWLVGHIAHRRHRFTSQRGCRPGVHYHHRSLTDDEASIGIATCDQRIHAFSQWLYGRGCWRRNRRIGMLQPRISHIFYPLSSTHITTALQASSATQCRSLAQMGQVLSRLTTNRHRPYHVFHGRRDDARPLDLRAAPGNGSMKSGPGPDRRRASGWRTSAPTNGGPLSPLVRRVALLFLHDTWRLNPCLEREEERRDRREIRRHVARRNGTHAGRGPHRRGQPPRLVSRLCRLRYGWSHRHPAADYRAADNRDDYRHYNRNYHRRRSAHRSAHPAPACADCSDDYGVHSGDYLNYFPLRDSLVRTGSRS